MHCFAALFTAAVSTAHFTSATGLRGRRFLAQSDSGAPVHLDIPEAVRQLFPSDSDLGSAMEKANLRFKEWKEDDDIHKAFWAGEWLKKAGSVLSLLGGEYKVLLTKQGQHSEDFVAAKKAVGELLQQLVKALEPFRPNTSSLGPSWSPQSDSGAPVHLDIPEAVRQLFPNDSDLGTAMKNANEFFKEWKEVDDLDKGFWATEWLKKAGLVLNLLRGEYEVLQSEGQQSEDAVAAKKAVMELLQQLVKALKPFLPKT